MLAHVPLAELAAVLDALVEETLALARLAGPPVDAFAVAQALGVAVASDPHQPCRGRYVRLQAHRGVPQPAIVLRPDPRPERLHWAAAHELGEHLVVQVYGRLGLDSRIDGSAARESLANHLARRLLLPTSWFSADGARVAWDLAALKARYSTASHELLARRMLEFDQPVIVSIFDQGQLYFRRTCHGRRAPSLCPEEHCLWQEVHQRGRPTEMRAGALWIRGWPVHEAGWKREILRTEPAIGE